jgi:hypothetical protein
MKAYTVRIWPTASRVAAVVLLILGVRFLINLALGHVAYGTVSEGLKRIVLAGLVCLLRGLIVAAIGDWADKKKIGKRRWNE